MTTASSLLCVRLYGAGTAAWSNPRASPYLRPVMLQSSTDGTGSNCNLESSSGSSESAGAALGR